MLKFSYTGRDRTNQPVQGNVEAETKEDAINILQKSGIIPLEIEISTEAVDILIPIKEYFGIGLPKLTELILFCRQMYSLTKAGVPIIAAINVVASTVRNLKMALALKEIVVNLESGQSLAVSIKKFPTIFPNLLASMVQVGENTGSLDTVFKQIALHLEKENQTKRNIKMAMRYPSMVIITIAIAVAIINIVVVPAFSNFFSKFKIDLPLPTRILIAVSNFTVHYWWLLLMLTFIITILLIIYLKTPQGSLLWDRNKLKLPFVGSIIETSLLARFARTFALCDKTGVPLLEAIELIARSTDNLYLEERILSMKEYIAHGESLANSAKAINLFTPLVMQMIRIGEETGEVARLLDEVADFYEEEIDYDLKRLTDTIEPVLIGIVACMVLVLALGVFLPMWDISKVALGG